MWPRPATSSFTGDVTALEVEHDGAGTFTVLAVMTSPTCCSAAVTPRRTRT